jgi:hypothetical protein
VPPQPIENAIAATTCSVRKESISVVCNEPLT